MRSLSIGASGMLAQQMNVEVISNNIANMTTTGFKRQRAEFQDLLYQTVVRPGAQSSDAGTIVPAGIQIGTGVKEAAIYRINEQGNLTSTSNPLDLAVDGQGFFPIELPSGETGYTRAGSFQLNANGEVVTAQGYKLSPGIVVPADTTDITINETGEVFAKLAGTTTPQNLGQIQLASFANPAGLDAQGENLFLETPASGSATTANPGTGNLGTIKQAELETSNVNVVQEITNLITAQRAYEMNSRVIKTSDEMLSAVNQLR